MCYLYFVPSWFNGFDAISSILIVFLTCLTIFFSISIYKFNKMWNVRLLVMSFGFLSVGYAIQAVHNSVLFFGGYKSTCPPVSFLDVVSLTAGITLIHTIFIMSGLLLMLFLVLKVQRISMFWVLFIVTVYSMIFSVNIPLTFFILGSLYLSVISFHFVKNYFKTRTSESLIIAEAFLLLLLSFVAYIFALKIAIFYVLANLLALLSFVLITLNLIMIKNGAKK